MQQVRARARAKRQDKAAKRLQALARGWVVRRRSVPTRPQCAVCFEEIDDAAAAASCGEHHACGECLARLGADAAARPLVALTDSELQQGRYAVRCPCSGMGCGGIFSTRDLDGALQASVARDKVEQAEALYTALVAIARAQQPLSAMLMMASTLQETREVGSAEVAVTSSDGDRSRKGGNLRARAAARKAAAEATKRQEAQKAKEAAEAAAQLELERELIRAQFRCSDGRYAAHMCGKCGFGPVEHTRCSDLAAHHGEASGARGRVSNGCPACGWFSERIGDWPRWDGVNVGHLTVAAPPRRSWPSARRVITLAAALRRGRVGRGQRQLPSARPPSPVMRLRPGEWQCSACTLVNHRRATDCLACGGPRV